MFGGALDGLAKRLGLRPAQLTAAQRAQPATRRVGLLGALAGVVAGCSLGLLNLFLVDTRQSSDLKARHFAEAGAADRHAFQIEADNAAASDATTLVVEGPDLPGLLASLSAALSASGVHLVEASVRAGDVQGSVRDVFVVRGRDGGQVDDDSLDDLARCCAAFHHGLRVEVLPPIASSSRGACSANGLSATRSVTIAGSTALLLPPLAPLHTSLACVAPPSWVAIIAMRLLLVRVMIAAQPGTFAAVALINVVLAIDTFGPSNTRTIIRERSNTRIWSC